MSGNDKFNYTYSAPTEDERREIENIRRQFVSEEKTESKLEKLRRLNNHVRKMPLAVGIVVCIVGVLILGLGMTMVLEWQLMLWGVLVGIAGIAVTAAAYPIYKVLLKRGKKKYGAEIVALSDEILSDGER